MMSSSVCPLPKLRKWKKTFRDTGIIATGMLMFRNFVIVCRATWNGRICGNNLSQVNYTQSYAPEATVWLTLFFIIGLLTAWHPWIVKNFGQTIERKSPWTWRREDGSYEDALTMGLGIVMTKSLKTLGITTGPNHICTNEWKLAKACEIIFANPCESTCILHARKHCERCIYC